MTETEAANTGRLWDQLSVSAEPIPMGVWYGNMTIESHRARHYQLRWARGLFDENQRLKSQLAKANATKAA